MEHLQVLGESFKDLHKVALTKEEHLGAFAMFGQCKPDLGLSDFADAFFKGVTTYFDTLIQCVAKWSTAQATGKRFDDKMVELETRITENAMAAASRQINPLDQAFGGIGLGLPSRLEEATR